MESSYDKILRALMLTEDYKEVEATFVERLSKEPLIRYMFSHRVDSTAGAQVTTGAWVQHYEAPNGAGRSTISTSVSNKVRTTNYYPDRKDVVRMNDIHQIVHRNFNTPRCKTYNCKLSALLDGIKTKHKVTLDPFADRVRQHWIAKYSDLFEAHKARTLHKAQELFASEEFLTEEKRYYERIVIDEIRTTVLKYTEKVGPEVIKMALDEVIAHQIMDS